MDQPNSLTASSAQNMAGTAGPAAAAAAAAAASERARLAAGGGDAGALQAAGMLPFAPPAAASLQLPAASAGDSAAATPALGEGVCQAALGLPAAAPPPLALPFSGASAAGCCCCSCFSDCCCCCCCCCCVDPPPWLEASALARPRARESRPTACPSHAAWPTAQSRASCARRLRRRRRTIWRSLNARRRRSEVSAHVSRRRRCSRRWMAAGSAASVQHTS